MKLKFSYQRIKTTFIVIVKNVKVIVKNGLSACNNIRKLSKDIHNGKDRIMLFK